MGMLLTGTDPANPHMVIAAPPLFVDVVAAGYDIPAERCVEDCVILAHAYVQFGIVAQIRAVELIVTDVRHGWHQTWGNLAPYWQDDLMHGHTVLWLPEYRYLVDPTIEQVPEIAALGRGPLVAEIDTRDPDSIEVDCGGLMCTYTFAPPQALGAALTHPIIEDDIHDLRWRGINVASGVLDVMAEALPPDSRLGPPRAAALLEAVRHLESTRTHDGSWRYYAPGSTEPSQGMKLTEIPLPANTPPPATVHLTAGSARR